MDQDADFAEFAAARWSSMVRSAVFLGCTIQEAHDLTQTALLRCYTAWRNVQKADDRDAYVYRVLLNCHRDSRRRRWWGEYPTSTPPDRASDVDAVETLAIADAVHRALAELSTGNREVVVLRYFVHLSEQQTAEVLGIATGTVKSRLSRALAQLASSAHLAEGSP